MINLSDTRQLFERAKTLLKREKYEDAADVLVKILKIRPNYSQGWNQLGICYLSMGEMKKALTSFRKSVSLDSENINALKNLGITYCDLGVSQKAINIFKKLVKTNPNNPAYWNDLGFAYEQAGYLNRAARAYIKSLDLDPEFRKAWENLAEAYISNGITFQYEDLNPKNEVSWFLLAKSLNKSRFYKEALFMAKKSLSINPSFHEPYKLRKEIIEMKKQKKIKEKKLIEEQREIDYQKTRKEAQSGGLLKPRDTLVGNVSEESPSVGLKQIRIGSTSIDKEEFILIIDGSNLALDNPNDMGQAKYSNFVQLRDKMRDLGVDNYYIITDNSLKHRIDDSDKYMDAVIDKEIIESPPGSDADLFILQYAQSEDAYIISNDQFKQHYDRFGEKWIREHRISFKFIGDKLFFDKLYS